MANFDLIWTLVVETAGGLPGSPRGAGHGGGAHAGVVTGPRTGTVSGV